MGRNITINSFFCQSEVMAKCIVSLPTTLLFHAHVTRITQKYISCLKDQQDKHYLCRELSKEYLQCRMDRQLMASEDLDKVSAAHRVVSQASFFINTNTHNPQTIISMLPSQLGFSEAAKVEKAVEYDKSKEKEGYVAGKHIDGRTKWWFQKLW